MKPERYSLSFTAGSLFHPESVKLAALFLELNDWNAVRDQVLSNNLLQTRTMSTARRVCGEIISRLKTLAPREIHLLAQGTAQEQAYLLWMAVCRRYRFIADFAVEVVRERYISLKNDLHHEDFDAFFNGKSTSHPELDELRPATLEKLRQVLFKMLRQTGLLTEDNTINTTTLGPRLLEAIAPDNRRDVLLFPAFEADFGGRAQ